MLSPMAFSSIFKKASNLLGFTTASAKPPPLDGEIIYCKNNVCVHPPATLTSDKDEHHHGYLTLRSTSDKVNGPTLILTWIPNSTLRKNTKSIENSPNRSQGTTPKTSPHRRTPRQEFAKPDGYVTTPSTSCTSLSPMESCVSLGSELGERGAQNVRKKKSSLDSINSDFSMVLKEDSTILVSPDEDHTKNHSGTYENSGQVYSNSDSAIGSFENNVQNNEKCVAAAAGKKGRKVGQNVNKLYAENFSKFNADLNNLTKAVYEEETSSSSAETDTLETAEKLTQMMRVKKLSSRTDSNRSVSIEIDGDSITVTTEELDDDVIVDCKNQPFDPKNINRVEARFKHQESNGSFDAVFSETETVSLNTASKEPTDGMNELTSTDTEIDGHSSASGTRDTHRQPCVNSIKQDSERAAGDDVSMSGASGAPPHPQSLNLSAINTSLPPGAANTNPIPMVTTPDICVTRLRNSSGSSTTTSGPDSDPPSPCSSSPSECWEPGIVLDSPSTGSECMSHNLQFPEMSLSKQRPEKDKKSAKDQVCGVFSVDLGQMRSLRVFYSNPENTTGQIVIASRESQYKILHFHHGGLDKLAEIFQDWSLFATSHENEKGEPEKHYKQFMIMKPQLTDDQCHPEEGVYSVVTEDIWHTHMMDDGIVEDDYQLRKAIFFGGLEPSLRHEAWPFLLHYFPFDSTFEEREQIRNDRYIEYQNIRKKRECMSEEDQGHFWRSVQCTVEKDVVRTDRSHPYFKGENNPNIEVLKNILLNYAVANPTFGYTQGMSDLLAPVLAEVQHEVNAYWCFVGLMQKTIFVSSPKDCDMDKQLTYLRELLRLMQPSFYEHLKHLGDDAMELLFAHRWILLCFKREFNEKDSLRIWESCWSHHQTDYFHLFICVAIVAVYGDDVIEQCLPADEILLHFSSLACHMSGELVLRKARGLLHEYRKRPVIPCTLHGLCSLCGQGMWDSGHVPTVQCVDHHPGDGACPYLSPENSPE